MKNHIVMVDSAFGKKVGFTSQNFTGSFVFEHKVKVFNTGRGGPKRRKIGAQEFMDKFAPGDSYLWLDEPNMRVILVQLSPRDHNIFGMDDLMVNIAQLGYDVTLAHPIKAKEYAIEEPYTWVMKEEHWRGEDKRMYTMSCTDILTKIHPLVLKKIRLTHTSIVELLQQKEVPRLKKIDMINYAITLADPKAPLIAGQQSMLLPDQEINRRYVIAEDILFAYFFRDNPTIFPPNPFKGRKILKQEGVKVYNGESWETMQSNAQVMLVGIPGMVGSSQGVDEVKEIPIPIPNQTTPHSRQLLIEQNGLTDFIYYLIGGKKVTRQEHFKWLHPTSNDNDTNTSNFNTDTGSLREPTKPESLHSEPQEKTQTLSTIKADQPVLPQKSEEEKTYLY